VRDDDARLTQVVTSASSPPSAPHAEYRRQARRIRGSFANAPHLRMRALRDLANRYDARRTVERRRRAPTLPAQPAATFAALVRERMDGPVLRYSHRTALIHAAERSGIGRFEANLIIAAIQHEAGERAVVEETRPSRRSFPSWLPVSIAAIATQVAILLGVWSLIH